MCIKIPVGGPYRSILGERKATWMKRSRARRCTGPYWEDKRPHGWRDPGRGAVLVHTGRTQGCTGEEIPGKMLYWFILGGHKAARVKRSRARCCTGPYWEDTRPHRWWAPTRVAILVHTGPRWYGWKPCQPRDPSWGAGLVHLAPTQGDAYVGVPSGPPDPFLVQTGLAQGNGRSSSSQLGHRSGWYWFTLGSPREMQKPQGEAHSCTGPYWGVSGALQGSVGFQGVSTSPGGVYGVPVLTRAALQAPSRNLQVPTGHLWGLHIGLCVPREDLQSPWCPTGPCVDPGVPTVASGCPKRTYGSPCGVYGVPTWSYGCPCWPTAPRGGVEVPKVDLRVPMWCLRGPYMVLRVPLLTYSSPWWCRGLQRGPTGPHAVSTGSLHGRMGAPVDLHLPMVV